MSKVKISLIIFVIAYIAAGTIYSEKSNSCEQLRLLANPELSSGAPENEGNNLIGRTITTLSWPGFLIGDKVNKTGIFDCKK